MSVFRIPLVMLAAAGFAFAAAVDLKPGLKTPALEVTDWIKGAPVKEFQPGRVYVVEFWATWCGPCRTSIPHLTELAKKHAKDVTVIGVSVWENAEDIPSHVRAFVEDMGAKMDYTVALDGDKKMAESWMKAAGQRGIPAAFIVDRQGRVAWIGHPMRMDEPLAQVVDGTFDLEASIRDFESKQKANEEREKKTKLVGDLRAQYEKGEKAQALKGLDEIAGDPDVGYQATSAKLELLASDDLAAAKALADDLIAKNPEVGVSVVAQFIGGTAMRAGQGDEGAKNRLNAAVQMADALLAAQPKPAAFVLYYCGMAYNEAGDPTKAVTTLQRALQSFDADETLANNEGAKSFRKAIETALEKARAKKG